MPFTLGKIDETEPTPTSTRDIPGFEVSVYYSNTMKALYQFIYLGGNRVSSDQLLRHGRYCLPLRSAELFPLIQNAFT